MKLAQSQKIVLSPAVIGGSKSIGGSERPLCQGGAPLLLRADTWVMLTGALLFGGVGGAWFAPTGALVGNPLLHSLWLGAGVMLAAALVAISGSLICGRNAIRWGVGMPLSVYLLGSLLALACHPGKGAVALLLGLPVFAGLIVATALLSTYLIDPLLRRLGK